MAVTLAESYISNGHTVEQIEAALESMCALLPQDYQSTCDAFVEQYTPQLINWIVEHGEPHAFCVKVGLCASKLELNLDRTAHRTLEKIKSGGVFIRQFIPSTRFILNLH